MARKGNPISVRLDLNRSSDSSWFSDYYYGKSVYQDVNLRSYFGSIRPPTRLTFGFRLGRCIIIHFPKRTFIHFFLPRRPRRLKRREKSRPVKEKGRWGAFGKVGPIGCLHSSEGTEEERNEVRGRGAGKRVESIRIWAKKVLMSLSRLFPRSNSSLGNSDSIPGVKTKSIKCLLALALVLLLFQNYYSGGALEGFFAACDEGRDSPSGPFYPPGREAQPHIPEPEVAPIPRAVLVPELERPLLPDIQRRVELQHRLPFYFIGRNEPRHLPLFLGILEKQFLLEKRVEAGLVRDGFPPQIVLARRSEIRNLLFNHPTRGGVALTENTLNRYLGQVERDGTQQSVPYLRVLRAARYWV